MLCGLILGDDELCGATITNKALHWFLPEDARWLDSLVYRAAWNQYYKYGVILVSA